MSFDHNNNGFPEIFAIALSPLNPTQTAIALVLQQPARLRSHSLPSIQPKQRSRSVYPQFDRQVIAQFPG